MSSIIEGYNYDIFISYRQKDNKGDRWVSEFVEALKTELESTFKEEISVYFDINPHDGLLETDDVDASLKDKLKCLVFIPIISRTYCDSKSFAWEHEFKAFVDWASQDQFGLKVKLPNGNVASRVLPIRIHDLDNDDIKLCELILGGVLRGVEFIYKEPGVNKPLTSDDDEKKNLNGTKYRIQINKVANAIKEIISGLKTEPVELGKEKIQHREPLEEVKKEERKEVLEKPNKLSKRKLLTGSIVLAVLLVIAGILAYPKIFKRSSLEKLRLSGEKITVAVMPFQNMTNDTTWNVWQKGIQELLTSFLSNSKELMVRQTEPINSLIQSKGLTNYASLTTSVASNISQKLDANVFVNGNMLQTATTIRLSAQLIDSKSEEVFKSFQIEGTVKNILHIVDSLSVMVERFLVISKMGKGISPDLRPYKYTNSPKAYEYFILAGNVLNRNDSPTALKFYSQAVAEDSNFFVAALFASIQNTMLGRYEDAKEWCLKAYKKRDQMPLMEKIMTDWVYAILFETPHEEIKNLKLFDDPDEQLPVRYWQIGNAYNKLFQYDNAIPEFEKTLKIYKKWKIKPMFVLNYTTLGLAYHKTEQYSKEKILYKKAELDFPDDPELIYRQAILLLSEKDTVSANRYIDKYVSIRKENSASEAAISTSIAEIFSEGGLFDKSEKYYQQALSLEPENPVRMNNLAHFLIDKERNINEGLELVNKALAISPENYNYLHTKGWGLYKQGKYQDALKLLQKSDSLKPIYSHEIFLHLEAAKKAVANQKNNLSMMGKISDSSHLEPLKLTTQIQS